MSRPIQREINYRDNSPPLIWGFGPEEAPDIPAGAQFELEVVWYQPNQTTLTFTSPNGGLTIDYTKGNVNWNYTEADTKRIPLTHRVGYTLWQILGPIRTTRAYGPLLIKTGMPL